jgi:hypothetical protein
VPFAALSILALKVANGEVSVVPIYYDILGQFTRLRGNLVVSNEELEECVADLRASPTYRSNTYLLLDIANVTSLHLENSGLRHLIELADDLRNGSEQTRLAIVSGPEPHHKGMARMLTITPQWSDQICEIAVFEKAEEAEDWLK